MPIEGLLVVSTRPAVVAESAGAELSRGYGQDHRSGERRAFPSRSILEECQKPRECCRAHYNGKDHCLDIEPQIAAIFSPLMIRSRRIAISCHLRIPSSSPASASEPILSATNTGAASPWVRCTASASAHRSCSMFSTGDASSSAPSAGRCRFAPLHRTDRQ